MAEGGRGGQLPLPLAWKAARGQKDFYVSPANAEAVRFLDGWAIWPVPVALLVGPEGSGKTHLGQIFARRANARFLDDADRAVSHEALFHAWNEAVDARRPLLLAARSAPADWHVKLPDLRSRLAATPIVRIGPPDDALLLHLFAKLWRDRGITPPPELGPYVLKRIERSFAAVAAAVAALDAAALAERRPLSIPLARAALLDLARSTAAEDALPSFPVHDPGA
ncbi:HdaA/DnaA family protein [Thermaurantiacus tibetensis]|uniref:HdaA/DnaA family protein n=1 Tax=Thermaurantiacus tibetensis TaxID=2759035 RepID=UPI00188E9D3C|nr:chromosomal replication initiator DnaA [Thermaurantiacus tibetensis]